jgi:hypothetical protein
MEQKAEKCIYGMFEKHIHNDWRCLRYGDDRPINCEQCKHFITDDIFEDVRRIKYNEAA